MVVEPALTRWLFTVLFALISATCLVRLLRGGRDGDRPPGTPRRHDDIGHIVMGISMIAMILSWTALLPTVVWIALFGGQAVVFCVILLRRRGSHAALSGQENWDHTHHVMSSLAMVYMVVAMRGSAGAGMSSVGMSNTGVSAVGMSSVAMPSIAMSPLAEAFGVYFLICAVWAALRALQLTPSLSPALAGPPAADGGRTVVDARAVVGAARMPAILRRPLLVDGCRALMGGGMAYLLLTA
jgi:Domain of unknown function (DUF5134)